MPLWLSDVLDTEHPDMPWQPPAKLPTTHDLRDAIARCDLTTEGAVTPAYAKQCFAKLLMAFEPNTKLSGDETRLRVSVWLEACGDLNDALWADATGQAIQTMKWMPKPAEFRALVTPQLDKARKRKARLRKMLDLLGRPVVQPFVKEPRPVRLRTLVNSYRKVGDDARAAPHELELARAEGREPDAWAKVAPIVSAPPSRPLSAPLPQPSLEMRIALLKASIRFFKDMGMTDIVAIKERDLAELELPPDTRAEGTPESSARGTA